MLTMPRAEGLVVAFSSDWNAKDEGYSVIRDVAALANTVGGDLYVGIGRDGHVVGVDDPDRLEQCVLRAVRHDIQPSLLAFVSAERISVEGKHVLRVHVDAGTGKPYCLNERPAHSPSFRRKGGVKQAARKRKTQYSAANYNRSKNVRYFIIHSGSIDFDA